MKSYRGPFTRGLWIVLYVAVLTLVGLKTKIHVVVFALVGTCDYGVICTSARSYDARLFDLGDTRTPIYMSLNG